MRRGLTVLSLLLAGCHGDPGVPSQPVEAPRHDFKWIGYDPATADLSIQFNDGARSNFVGVPAATYEQLMRSPEKRTFFTNSIQGHYESRAEP